ncbi:MAG: hypothetical protein SFY92_03835 [Verrucomicrobiae bacterium]|nr:hypothetical protein [Verrucomicrobiae bacterium]
MDKKTQFIMMVQTALITKYVCDPGDGSASIARPMWSINHMDDAFKVASCIPPDVNAREAAEAFIRWVFHQPFEPDDEAILEIILPK